MVSKLHLIVQDETARSQERVLVEWHVMSCHVTGEGSGRMACHVMSCHVMSQERVLAYRRGFWLTRTTQCDGTEEGQWYTMVRRKASGIPSGHVQCIRASWHVMSCHVTCHVMYQSVMAQASLDVPFHCEGLRLGLRPGWRLAIVDVHFLWLSGSDLEENCGWDRGSGHVPARIRIWLEVRGRIQATAEAAERLYWPNPNYCPPVRCWQHLPTGGCVVQLAYTPAYSCRHLQP